MPAFTPAEITEALPVILSLIVIEGLLSVDNALAIAAMASHLPGRQKFLALRLGIIGAYAFRGLALAFAAFIIDNPWLKICGAAYLLYLMCEHFTGAGDEDDDGVADSPSSRGFWGTVIAIEVMDLSLSVDNVVAAVAMSPKLWVVCTGVFIGILALRFVAGLCIRLIERYPILEDTAFLLIGYVGGILLVELSAQPLLRLAEPLHVSSLQKFAGIALIMGLSVGYGESPTMRRLLQPVVRIARWPMWLIAFLAGIAIKSLIHPFKLLWRGVHAQSAKETREG